MLAVGVEAFPMVAIMAVCSGFILAMQRASELRRFGRWQFVVDLVTIGFTRESGPLLTAIALSGRSGGIFGGDREHGMSLALVSGGGRVVHILIGLLARARL
jgi:phospholipid/cholesterol/gamma-HCH transport system permease protein